ncbi:ecto-ADP-ribosyltransferase 4-like [Kryptolebias marmoratus]|uniref:NAD(P)(+)--arginine ADP-ribosyltransferase n=1 Tax=Kryptolebias marmoratus TaxID=37003 RepID=A0A3Q2ZBE7_KRYMA|nr:ecto-ADP-ribosyltransferase 4-like [Kryptolebias marmoratus]
MFDRKQLLLTVIIYTTVHVSKGFLKPLNKTMNVVDDRYDGCHEEAMKTFIPDQLEEELNKTEGFQKAWSANSRCSSLIPGGTKDHTSALSALHFGDTSFLKELAKAVETMGANLSTYQNDFHFKSLHFLVMDSMRLLNQNKTCKDFFTFSEMNEIPSTGSKLRFSRFTTVHSDFEGLGDVDGETILKIQSCFYVDLDNHICQKELLKTLLSPVEVFTVTDSKQIRKGADMFTQVVLSHQSFNSNHNCYMFPRSAAVISTQSFLLLLVASLLASSHV